MKNIFFPIVLLVSLCACHRESDIKVEIDQTSYADLGNLQIFHTDQTATGLLFLLSTIDSDPKKTTTLATQLAQQDWLVANIDISNFLKNRRSAKASCFDIVTLLDVFSQSLQQQYHFTSYQRPVLIGESPTAGSLVYLMLAAAANGIFGGGISLGLQYNIELPLLPCSGLAAIQTFQGAKETSTKQQTSAVNAVLKPVQSLATPWSLWIEGASTDLKQSNTHKDKNKQQQFIDTLVARIPSVKLHPPVNEFMDATWFATAQDDLHLNQSNPVSALPLVELPVEHSDANYFAVIISGDGGWANIDKEIGDELNGKNINVVGWNSLQYFWTRRTPEMISEDLAKVIRHYCDLWQKPKVLLIGFSLGADVLPMMVGRLAESERNRIANLVLLGPSHQFDIEFHVTDWLPQNTSSNAQPTAPELAKIPMIKTQCFYGTDDDDVLCPDLKRSSNMTIIAMPGDHHFDDAYEEITRRIIAGTPNGTSP